MAVGNVTSFGRNGLSDWLLQRVSAVVMTVYMVFVFGYLVCGGEVTYADWKALHGNFFVRLLSLFAVLSLAAHAWIGMWGVLTDYVTVRLLGPRATAIRIFLQLGMIAMTLTYVVWAIVILWGI
ncbi:MAG: succinate dehydrogenase, hydrophobic membrane anchor protein [Gammaproteobacteria bacterium]|nr:MAG: succinate dehydrogenase, hydrophobic membrane anchor protein [Gammaproteobacteria bacterium]RLA53494.1 MAG: succinate dehydrogenase, hydrophobic membrane anchor protein [Gammaproteobacteria bacterium]